MKRKRIAFGIVMVAISLMVGLAIREASSAKYMARYQGDSTTAEDVIHIKDHEKCFLPLMMAMQGQTMAELNAYQARHVEEIAEACGAEIEKVN